MEQVNSKPVSEALTLVRLMVLIKLLSEKSGLTRESMLEYLKEKHLSVSDRQLQRDLRMLGPVFGIESTQGDDSRARWESTNPDAWRGLFTPVGHGSTNLGEDPLHEDHPTLKPIVTTNVGGRRLGQTLLRLLRILLIVESLPSEMNGGWAGLDEVAASLCSKGLNVNPRTLQRDMKFIRNHFLVWSEKGQGRKQLWQRLEDADWTRGFEPRFPTVDLGAYKEVQDFLYRKPPSARLLH